MLKNFIELSQVDVKITKKPTFKYNKAKQEYEEVEVIENTEAKERLKEIFDKWLDENLKQ